MYKQLIPKQDYSKIVKAIGYNEKPTISDAIIQTLGIHTNSKILELGCGTGGDAKLIKNKTSANIIGVDIDKHVIEYAKNYIPVLEFDITSFPYPLETASFDGVFGVNLLQLIPNKEAFFLEVFRLLKSRGSFFSMITTKKQIQDRYINRYFPSLMHVELNRHMFQKELISSLENVGFKNIKEHSIFFDICTIDRKYLDRLKSGIMSSLLLLDEYERNAGLEKLERDIDLFEKRNEFPQYKRIRTALVSQKLAQN